MGKKHNDPLRFRRPCGGQLQIATKVVQLLGQCRQLGAETPEAGGLLIGRRIEDTEHVIIDYASVPHPDDRATRTTFERLDAGHQALLEELWSASEGALDYVGEWHTHPNGEPEPSETDRSEWRRLAQEIEREHDALFYVIVTPSGIGAFEVADGGRIYTLACCGGGDVWPDTALTGELLCERQRQRITWTQVHDDAHTPWEWVALLATLLGRLLNLRGQSPATYRRRLVQLGATVLAALEAHDRRAAAQETP